MNKAAVFFVAGASFLALSYPTQGVAQQPGGKRITRPAARPTASPKTAVQPAATPAGTPGAIPVPASDSKSSAVTSEDPADTAEPTTVIDAYERTTFTSKDRIVVFRGKVKVVDPRFQLVCDELTVFLNKANQPGTGPATAPATTVPPTPTPATNASGNTAPAEAKPSGGGGIDHAIAKGHVIILQKRAATKDGGEEKISIGRGEEGSFDNKTGDMTLKGTPSIEQNGNTHVATSPDTVMTIHRDGGLETLGPAQTKLTQRKGGGGFDLPGGPGATDGTKKSVSPTPAPQATPAAKRPTAVGRPHA